MDTVAICDIKINGRHRSDLGDIDGLAVSIAEIGLLHPVVVTPDLTLIAGQRRIEACKRLGWASVPVHVVDIDEILDAEIAENTIRKDFAPSEAVAIGQALEERERERARERQGTRTDLELPGNFPEGEAGRVRDKVAAALGMSGRTYEKAKEVVKAAEKDPRTFGDLVERMDKSGKVNGAHKKKKQREEELELQRAAEEAKRATDLYQLIEGDFRTVCQQMEPDSVDVIITDPPYPREYLGLFGDLAEVAARVLKPGGSLLAMAGQSYLPEVLSLIMPHLRYHWMVAYLTPGGQSVQLWQRQVNTFWKPVLWFVKGEYGGDWVGDVARSETNDNDKRFHQWGQSESGMRDLVDRFSKPGELILDPMMGAGTTGVAAISLGRRFVGIDNDADKVQIATGRLASAS